MQKEMLKLAEIADAFEKSGDFESGKIITEAMKEISAFNFNLRGQASRVIDWLSKMLEGILSPEAVKAILDLAIQDLMNNK